MRVLQIVADLGKGSGIAEVVLCLADAARSVDMVLAATGRVGAELARSLERKDVRVVRFRLSFLHFFCFSWEMVRGLGALIREADVIHVHGAWTFPVWWGCHLALRHHKPLVRTPHGSFTKRALLKSAWKKRLVASLLERRYLKRATRVHATSGAESEELLSFTPGIAPVIVIPNGVDYPRLEQAAPVRDKTSPRTVLLLSRLDPMKGVEDLIAAWTIIARDRQAADQADDIWRLLIVGPGEVSYRKKLARTLSGLDCRETVSLEGPVYGLAKWALIRSAELVVLPTHSDCFGLVVGEALACGVPVITTKGAPWQELLGSGVSVNGKRLTECGKPLSNARQGEGQQFTVNSSRFTDDTDNGRCGWWVEVGVEPLAEALREAMGLTDEERHAMGENGRRLVKEKYRWESVAERMSAVYSGIVSREQ